MEREARIAWVDCAKGIAMILVIIGHAIGIPFIRGPIYSFHMPLFFILSGYTTVCAQNEKELTRRLKKSFFNLVVLAYMLFTLTMAIPWLPKYTNTVQQKLLAGLWASGDKFNLNGTVIPHMGLSWFLIALFWVRNLYDALHYITKGRHMTLLSLAITVMGVVIGQQTYLPLGLDHAMAVFVFFDFGQILKSCQLQATLPRCIGLSSIWGGASWLNISLHMTIL